MNSQVRRLLESQADRHGMTVERMCSPDRADTAGLDARACTMLLFRNAGWTTTALGRLFGRNHSTILHALERLDGPCCHAAVPEMPTKARAARRCRVCNRLAQPQSRLCRSCAVSRPMSPGDGVGIVGNTACQDCGGRPLGGGRWCLDCFNDWCDRRREAVA